ncbi:hypothetical protein CH063_12471 [Colletotrichum higginsianum]|uniref:Uncharacterized protein n=1 Tax=Colletotrichum higginsianum (strain IMI 349063) TaxID=759273 RepID=H1VQI2_COLHI|nr:hypothetical protein CH063_12471 [Colletotrichum higginsianum]
MRWEKWDVGVGLELGTWSVNQYPFLRKKRSAGEGWLEVVRFALVLGTTTATTRYPAEIKYPYQVLPTHPNSYTPTTVLLATCWLDSCFPLTECTYSISHKVICGDRHNRGLLLTPITLYDVASCEYLPCRPARPVHGHQPIEVYSVESGRPVWIVPLPRWCGPRSRMRELAG